MNIDQRSRIVITLSALCCSVAAGQVTNDDVLVWCRDFSSAGCFRITYVYEGLPEFAATDFPNEVVQSTSLSIRWPDAMIFDTNVRRADEPEPANRATSDGAFIRIFRPNATVSASTGGDPIVVSPKKVPFSDEAWRYCHTSPWIVAQMILNANPSDIIFQQKDEAMEVRLGKVGVAAIFKYSNDNSQLRIVQLSVLDARLGLETMYKYSDFRNVGPQGFSVPWTYSTTGQFRIIDHDFRRIRTSDFQLLGISKVLSCVWPNAIPDTEFDFPEEIRAVTANAKAQQNRQAPISAEKNGNRVTAPVPEAPTDSFHIQWATAIAAVIAVGLIAAILRKRAA